MREERKLRDKISDFHKLYSDHLWVEQDNENLRADQHETSRLEYLLEVSERRRNTAEATLANSKELNKARIAKLNRTHAEQSTMLQEGFEADAKDRDEEIKELKANKIELGKKIAETEKAGKMTVAYKDRDIRVLKYKLEKVKKELNVFKDAISEKRKREQQEQEGDPGNRSNVGVQEEEEL